MSFKKLFCAAVWSVVPAGVLVSGGQAETITLSVNTTTDSANGLDRLLPGDAVWFEIAVSVDNSVDGNNGLVTLVYDVIAQQTTPQLSGMLLAFSGFRSEGADGNPSVGRASNVSDDFYHESNHSISPDYGGGWGFTQMLPAGGDVTTSPGDIIATGATASLTWTADTHPNIPGLQPFTRPLVGIGAFTFGDDDPVLGGLQGGFGFDIVDNDITEGDGSWIIREGRIDTTAWVAGTYSFNVNPTAGAVYDGTLDYTTDMAGGFRVNVPTSDMTGTSFSFTIIPEPATLGLLLVAGLGLVRRRRMR